MYTQIINYYNNLTVYEFIEECTSIQSSRYQPWKVYAQMIMGEYNV